MQIDQTLEIKSFCGRLLFLLGGGICPEGEVDDEEVVDAHDGKVDEELEVGG